MSTEYGSVQEAVATQPDVRIREIERAMDQRDQLGTELDKLRADRDRMLTDMSFEINTRDDTHQALSVFINDLKDKLNNNKTNSIGGLRPGDTRPF
ncbi:MAG: hypothetical protein KKH61_21280 [Gammaproteobacteria bacterium]|uniref:Uncharacterized protein n=1 Tax=viral metagenome TaxID=1070528 RepID=A0A6H1ZAT0_9ZZZZ|nr:hypothetical protein [Gammaproteobacteria bacterium]